MNGTATPTNNVESLALDQIVASKTNRRIDKGALSELTESVRKRGVMTPVMVRPSNGKHELVFGHRRLRAARAAGLSAIPAMVRELSDAEALEAQLVENGQREDAHELEEADDFRRLYEEFGYSAEEIADKVGKSKSHVYQRMKLNSLGKEAREAFFAGELHASTAVAIARIPHAELQKRATKEILKPDYRDEPLSHRAALEHIKKNYTLRLADAPFSRTDTEIVPKAGPCNVCPKRTGNQPELFSGAEFSANVCTDPKCYRSKLDAHWKKLKAEAGEKGYRVLSDSENKKAFSGRTYLVHESGLVDLDDRAHSIAPYDKTYRELLQKHAADIAPVYARDYDGNIRKLADQTQVGKALSKAGVGKSSTSSTSAKPSRSDSERRAERRKKARKVAAKSSVELIVDAATKRKPDAVFWRLFALLVYEAVGTRPGNDALERRNISPPQNFYGSAKAKKILESVKKYSEAQSRTLALECLLTNVLEYYQGHDAYPVELAEAAKYFKVDLKKLEAAAAEQLAPKQKARKKILKRKPVKK